MRSITNSKHKKMQPTLLPKKNVYVIDDYIQNGGSPIVYYSREMKMHAT
jgi:hypothetical protein